MTTIPEHQAAIGNLERTRAALEARLRAIQQEIQPQIDATNDRIGEHRRAIAETVRAGASLGSSLEDYLCVHFTSKGEEAPPFFRMLFDGVRDHQGELGLVVENSARPAVLGGPDEPPSPYFLDETLTLGIIAGQLRFSLDESGDPLELPTSKYVTHNSRHPDGRPYEQPFSFPMGGMSYYYFRMPIKKRLDELARLKDGDQKPFHLDVLLGNDAVVEWFEARGHRVQTLVKLCERLGYPVESLPKLQELLAR